MLAASRGDLLPSCIPCVGPHTPMVQTEQLGPALALSHISSVSWQQLCSLQTQTPTFSCDRTVHQGSKVQPAGNMQQKGRIRRFLGCFRKTQKACLRERLAQRRSSSYVPKWRSEAHVQSVAQEPRCMARGLGRGFTPAHIHSQLGSCSDQMAQAAGGIGWRKGSGPWSFLTAAKWLRQTQIWHSHELLCSVNVTSIPCPGPQPCCTALWNEECFKGSCTHKDFLQKQFYTGSHHRNIWT